ncbi:hypothetical protein HID58_062605 [Brassica napus]|uniref:Uncharacterized protein n=1 Tax=Brassica napus TaxID=3708 RepID=A0ABQ8A212_BRANA|nr:hypothetical protein HID58_062605 [Brassica napus]
MKNGNYYKLRILIRLHKIRLLYATRRFDTSLPLHLSTRSLPASLPYESTLPRSRDSPLNPSQGRSFGLPQGLTNEARLCPTHWANTHSVEKDISFCVSFEPPNHL